MRKALKTGPENPPEPHQKSKQSKQNKQMNFPKDKSKRSDAAALQAQPAQPHRSPSRRSNHAQPASNVSASLCCLSAAAPFSGKVAGPVTSRLGQYRRPVFRESGRQLAGGVARRSGKTQGSCTHMWCAWLRATRPCHCRSDRPRYLAFVHGLQRPFWTAKFKGGCLAKARRQPPPTSRTSRQTAADAEPRTQTLARAA